MRQLQNRLLVVVVIGVLISTALTGGVYLIGCGQIERTQSEKIMTLEGENCVVSLDKTMTEIEKLVRALEDYYLNELDDIKALKQKEYYEDYLV